MRLGKKFDQKMKGIQTENNVNYSRPISDIVYEIKMVEKGRHGSKHM